MFRDILTPSINACKDKHHDSRNAHSGHCTHSTYVVTHTPCITYDVYIVQVSVVYRHNLSSYSAV